MPASPRWKVYSEDNEFIGALKYPEDAAAMVALRGSGTVRDGHRRVVWREGAEAFAAGDSYDGAAAVINERAAAAA